MEQTDVVASAARGIGRTPQQRSPAVVTAGRAVHPLLALQRQIGNAAMGRLVVQRECRELNWTDFQPVSGQRARTVYHFGESGRTFTVRFDETASTRGENVSNAYDSIVEECAASDFSDGGTYTTGSAPDPRCAAGRPPRQVTARRASHCESLVRPAVDTANRNESMRLLRHEQYHMNLACALVDKANTARANGTSVSMAALRATNSRQVRAYDNQTRHGCNQAQQTAWEGRIDGGLPGVRISVR